MERVISVISKGAAQSWQMENRWKPMTDGKFDGFGFAVDWMRKDLGICLAEAKQNGARITSYNVCYTKLLRCSRTSASS